MQSCNTRDSSQGLGSLPFKGFPLPPQTIFSNAKALKLWFSIDTIRTLFQKLIECILTHNIKNQDIGDDSLGNGICLF